MIYIVYDCKVHVNASNVSQAMIHLSNRAVTKQLEITFIIGDSEVFDNYDIWYPKSERFNPWRCKYYQKAIWKKI